MNLLQVTSTSSTEEIVSSTANTPNTINEIVKRTPIKLLSVITDGESDVVQRGRVEDAWEDEAIIRSHLRLHGSKDRLSNYPLNEEEEEIAKKKIVRTWNTLFHFFSNTSFHGLPHIIGSRRSYCRVTFWIIVILISLGLMLWAVISVTIQYAEKNTVLFTKRHFNNELRFPAVTICNKNLYRKSVTREAFPELNFDRIFLSERRNSLFSAFGRVFRVNDSEYAQNNSGHQIEHMLFYCQYAARICTRQNFVQGTSTSGNCYTFNSGENGSSVQYSMEGGYRFGLELILNAEQYEYFLADSDSVGFDIFIHDQGHFPYYGSVNSFSVSPGQSTQVALRKVDYKLQTPENGGQCDDDITLKYFSSYSRTLCIVECLTDFVVHECGCKGDGLPGPAQVCLPRDTCIRDSIRERFDQEQCYCPIECQMTDYAKTLSYAKFPADHIALLMNSSNFILRYPFPDFVISTAMDDNGREYRYLNDNFTESFISNNFAKVLIYYDDLISTTLEEGLEYSTFQFVADFGGHIGLFTGAGFLTLFEIIDLCYSLIRPIDE